MKGIAPAILFLYVLDAVLLTVPVSLILIWLYRRTVERAMQAASTAGEGAPSFPVAWPPRAPWNPVELRNRERRLRLRLALVYAVAGASATAVWTWLYFQTPGLEFAGIRGFAVWYVFCWPVPATLITLLAIPWRRSMWVVAAYIGAGMLAIVVWSTVSNFISRQPGVVLPNLQFSSSSSRLRRACRPSLS